MSARRAAFAAIVVPSLLLLAHPLAAKNESSVAVPAPVGLDLGGAPAPQTPGDPRTKVMSALQAELARSKRLTTEGFQPPYYVGYLLRDVTRLSVNGKYGAIYESGSDHSRNLYAQVRVGDYSFDSSGEGG